jgi:hypothetical protein
MAFPDFVRASPGSERTSFTFGECLSQISATRGPEVEVPRVKRMPTASRVSLLEASAMRLVVVGSTPLEGATFDPVEAGVLQAAVTVETMSH